MVYQGIQDPQELLKLSVSDLEHLAQEIRQKIITVCAKNGGHLGASLGAVELAISLHRVFRSPEEKIVWDVGHQAYAHKLLTGRWNAFETLRQEGGISGFPSPAESEHDPFFVGHSSTALSTALGLAWTNRGTEKWTVAVVGDGGLTAGISFEALNNVRSRELGPLLVVVNDNQFSISPSHGGISAALSEGRGAEFFSFFGMDYVGPIDGHDLNLLLGTLGGIRSHYQGRPVVIHALTQKGRGYLPAEENPAHFHGINPVGTAKVPGQGAKAEAVATHSFSQVLGETLCELAAKEPKLVAITAAMPEGTGLGAFSEKYSERFFDVGIAEPHAVTFAAGLAKGGYRPVVAIYSTFLQRAMDSVIHDVALQKLPVIFAIDRAGLVGSDGPTHHGVFDMAFLSSIPNLKVWAPACVEDLREMLALALQEKGPVAIRYPRGGVSLALEKLPHEGFRVHNLSDVKTSSPKVILLGVGVAAEAVAQIKIAGVSVMSTTQIKPISPKLVEELNRHSTVPLIVVEHGVSRGGFGEALLSSLSSRTGEHALIGISDHFVRHGSVRGLENQEGLSFEQIEKKVRSFL